MDQIKDSKLLPFVERVFSWGSNSSTNDIDIQKKYSVEDSEKYCRTYKSHAGKGTTFRSDSEHQHGA